MRRILGGSDQMLRVPQIGIPFKSITYYKNKAIELDFRAKKAILVGFGNNLYRLYNVNSKKVI